MIISTNISLEFAAWRRGSDNTQGATYHRDKSLKVYLIIKDSDP